VEGVQPNYQGKVNKNEIMDLAWVSLDGLDTWISET
jgi:hypothetical protein